MAQPKIPDQILGVARFLGVMALRNTQRTPWHASARIVMAMLLGVTAPAIGQEPAPPPQEQPVALPEVAPPQEQPVPTGVSPELLKQQRKQQQKQLRQQQKQLRQQQRAAAGVAPSGPSMKEVFAGTIAAVVQASGGALLTGVAQVVTGRLVDWFSQKLDSGGATTEQFAAAAALDGTMVPPPPDPGQAAPGDIAAGLAFEVHRLDPGGATMLVDPAVHEFRSGDRFVVFFRPSMPGRMDIYNINPVGQQTLIDVQELAAGQLTRLGPYEFTATTGDEQLRLVMQPCSTPQLVATTRDIVRVPDTVPAQAGMQLQDCNVSATRSVRDVPTRDIRKVTEEDGTQFALDLLSEEEVASGEVAPREVTIRFRHL
jgi:type II secretory pathway pseudopilin PulG